MFPFYPVHMDVAQQAWVGARVEERARTGNDVSALETELRPLLRYDTIWDGGQSHFVALYSPRFVYTRTSGRPDIDERLVNPAALNTADPNDTPLSALNNGGVGFEAVRRRFRVSAYQFAAYGPITTTTLLVQEPWSGEGYPAEPNAIIPSTIAARFTLLFLQTQIFVPIRLSQRVGLIPGFVYNAFGGADGDARAVMAMTRGPGASLALDVAATHRDRFVTTLGGGQIQTLFQGDRTGPEIYRAEARQAWRHWFSPTLSTDVEAGLTLGGDAINGFSVYTLAHAGLLYDSFTVPKIAPAAPPMGAPPGRGRRLQVGAYLKAQPWLDFFSGELVQRGVAVGAINYGLGATTLRAQLSAAHTLATPRSVAEYQLYQVEAGARYRLANTLSVDGGVRFGSQDFNNAIRFNQTTQLQVFAGITWAPLPARF